MAGFLKSNTNFIKRGNQVTRPASGTTAGRPTNPAAGEFRFNEDTNKVEYYDSAAWKNLSRSGSATVTKTTVVTGDGTTTAFTNFFTTARFYNKNFIENPIIINDILGTYTNEKLYIASIGVASRKYIQDKYIFNFNIIQRLNYRLYNF